MTAAGVATAAFIAILVGLYGAWTWLAYRGWHAASWEIRASEAIACASWIVAHIVAAVGMVAVTLQVLGGVAGWWAT